MFGGLLSPFWAVNSLSRCNNAALVFVPLREHCYHTEVEKKQSFGSLQRFRKALNQQELIKGMFSDEKILMSHFFFCHLKV